MKAANRWITYRTRFLVKAKQLNNSLNFTDVLGRQHSGSKGDYLVESSEGVLSIAPRQIFEDIYVPLLTDHGAIEEIAPSPNYLPTPVQRQPAASARDIAVRSIFAALRDAYNLPAFANFRPQNCAGISRPPCVYSQPALGLTKLCLSNGRSANLQVLAKPSSTGSTMERRFGAVQPSAGMMGL